MRRDLVWPISGILLYDRSNDDAAIEHRLNLLFQKTCCDSLLASSGVHMIRKFFLSAAVVYSHGLLPGFVCYAAAPEEQLIESVKVVQRCERVLSSTPLPLCGNVISSGMY